ncbi:plasmid mobilization relaxosome protein MobC [Prevotella fusca]|uniref:Mobilization protein n=1 Tax=Prevotella fusca JCM 17724 TaxID=1236517 RepID=A0A0K1NMM2_9BACT|nr:plasmid mobilization relaxosome protein MobC [Prevotella fusca]AKU70290.1 mobilization protein [Prevotella fusca JCM 17724]QUB85909.1 plasmid mobilization relaxosome protein MobC [Prevotella fusca JCM 17724]
MKEDKRVNRINLHLNNKELELFRNKANNYSQMSAMIRDAVTQFDDIKTKGWITALNDLSILISNFSTELSKQGGNLNQITKRANELIFMGELDKTYYEEVISHQIKLLQELVYDVKKQQSEIFKRLLKS